MTQSVLDQIPLLSMTTMSEADFAAAFGASFQRFGFAMVRDHDMDPAVIDKGWSLARRFFALPDAVKSRYDALSNGGQRGYTAFGREIAKGAMENDLKEFWHVGRDLPAGDPLGNTMPPNVWPEELPEFQPVLTRLFAQFDHVGARLLSAIAIWGWTRTGSTTPSTRATPSFACSIILPSLPRPPASARARMRTSIS
ncbi:non-haem dioxygenase, N-terminal [Sphingobium faniae]|nr:non-haem dioxygenase, N-terminal [Sphingobium faniae]